MGEVTPKQYLPLDGKPIALHSFTTIAQSDLVAEVVVVCDQHYEHHFHGARFARPGPRRQDSVFHGLQAISPDTDLILIHDIARPLLAEEDLENVILEGNLHGAATLATPVTSTIKIADEKLMVTQTLDRSFLYNIQTPQVLKKKILLEGFAKAHAEEITVTDDVSLAELTSSPVKLVMGSRDNIKITTPEDLVFAENILRERSALQI